MTQSETYNLKTFRNKFREQGIFYTPPELALFMQTFIPGTPKKVYDPTCGRGALLLPFINGKTELYGQDIDAAAIEDVKRIIPPEARGNFAHGNVLETVCFFAEAPFDAIVANPPFSIKWNPATATTHLAPTVAPMSKADFQFILHIIDVLDDNGTAVVLNSPGICYRGGREQVLRQWVVDNNWLDQVVLIPAKTFADTAIATALCVFKKNRASNATVLFVDRETQLEKHVSRDEIAQKGHSWGVNSYVEKPASKEPSVDMHALELDIRAQIKKSLAAEVRLSYINASLSGHPDVAGEMRDFVAELHAILDESLARTVSDPLFADFPSVSKTLFS